MLYLSKGTNNKNVSENYLILLLHHYENFIFKIKRKNHSRNTTILMNEMFHKAIERDPSSEKVKLEKF